MSKSGMCRQSSPSVLRSTHQAGFFFALSGKVALQVELVNTYYRSAAAHAPRGWGKVWHKYGIFNMMALRHRLEHGASGSGGAPNATCLQLILNAMHAFFQSVAARSSDMQHETLQVRC